jgi:hypothetical protein
MTEVKSHIFFPGFSRPRVRVGLDAEARDHTLRQASERVWARNYRRRLRLTDIATIVFAVTIAFSLRFGLDALPTSADIEDTQYIFISATIVVSWLVALIAFGVHDSRVIGVGASEYKRIINASATAISCWPSRSAP